MRPRLVPRAEQIDRLVQALAGAGWVALDAFDPSDRPVNLNIAAGSHVLRIRVFCWNVTSGGAHRAEDEYRVQTRRPGDVPLYLGGDLVDLVLGYYEPLDVFVAWDATLHRNPGSSSSLQVQLDHIEEAADRGFVARSRELGHDGETEVVAAFRPDAISHYLEAHPAFAAGGLRRDAVAATDASDADEPLEADDLPDDVERQRILTAVNRLARDARFRVRVLDAYEHRCAFCGLGAGLVHAAHIRPVALGGADQVRNGVAACPTHHAALDLGLILIGDAFQLGVNRQRLADLGISAEDADALERTLSDALHVPREAGLRPSEENLVALRLQWA